MDWVPPEDVTQGNTFWIVTAEGVTAPSPCLPPSDQGMPVYAITNNVFLVDTTGGRVDLQALGATSTADALEILASEVEKVITQTQTASANQQRKAMTAGTMMAVAGSGGGSLMMDGVVMDTNGLWLQITGISNSIASLILNNATNQVYAVWSATNLATPSTNWQVVRELFPADDQTNVLPFTVAAGQDILFLCAEDWTGVTHNGNQTPDWWFYYWFGATGLSNLLDNSLDSQGNTLLSDYEYGLDPNVISFSITVTNQFVNAFGAPLQLSVTAGTPSYFAVLVDSTNFADANWIPYSTPNLIVDLGSVQGWHNVWVGLRGLPSDATQTWEWKHLDLTLPPVLVITNPPTFVVDEPVVQIYGYCQDVLAGISYDISNAFGVFTNQPSEVTDQYYDTNACGLSTNYFECLDVPLTNGLNTITIHATDWAGDTTITNFNFTLDYSSKTNPPVVQITWPTNGTQISGGNFTLDGQLDDPTAAISVSIADSNGYTNVVKGLVERNGRFWIENIPLNSGTNELTLNATDAAGNTTVTIMSVIQSSLTLTMNPVADPSQLWQPTVNLTGTISDPAYAVWVNGVKGTNNANGTWSASSVPTTPGGTASFTIIAYGPDETQPDGSTGN